MTPSVLVVDYSMPQMNGVDLCEALRHLPCKKILFTGAADEKVAVDAFNRGLIDRYIKKSDDDALDRLESEIHGAAARIFRGALGAAARPARAAQLQLRGRPGVRATLVRDWSAEHGIVEHYLYPEPGRAADVRHRRPRQLMVVETEAGMKAHYEVARDNEAPPSLLDALHERRVIPCFHDGDGMYTEAFADGWHKYIAAGAGCAGASRTTTGPCSTAAGTWRDRARTRFLRDQSA